MRTPAQQNDVMRKLIARIRQNVHYARVPIVVIPENNLGFESSHIADYVRNMPNVSVFTENPGDLREGVRKTASNTDDYQRCVDRMLMLRQCYFDRDMFTSSKAYEKATIKFTLCSPSLLTSLLGQWRLHFHQGGAAEPAGALPLGNRRCQGQFW